MSSNGDVPLSNSNTLIDVPDPFEALFDHPIFSRAQATSADRKPLFAQETSSRKADPIGIIPRKDLSSEPPRSRPRAGTMDSDFGAFVSVSPTNDPLGVVTSFSPVTTGAGELAHEDYFDAAKQRADHDERRILGEILEHEETLPVLRTNEDSSSDLHSSLPITGRSSVIDLSSTISDPLPSSEETSDLTISQTSEPEAGSSSIPPSHHDLSASTPLPSSTPSSSLTHRLSYTLPRKWSHFLSGSHSASQSNPHAMIPSSPTTSMGTPSPSGSHAPGLVNIPITHDSPFASHLVAPPSGAPGFVEDRNWDKGFEFSPKQNVGQPVTLQGRAGNARPVLPPEIIESIRSFLPPLFRLSRKWTLLYSLDQHGISIATFYNRVSQHQGGCLLAIRDANDTCFGVWVGDGIRRSNGESYYGSGESFLWKQDGEEATRATVFKWTGKNDYVALCEPDYISFGGGDGKYGLFLDSSFLDGSSAPCPTFDNEPLCSTAGLEAVKKGTARFECVGLEAWGISR